MWSGDFLSVVRREHKPFRDTALIGYGTAGQKTVEEMVRQAVYHHIISQYPAVVIANWHNEALQSSVRWMSMHVRTLRPRRMLEGAPQGLRGDLDLAEQTRSEWLDQFRTWLSGVSWATSDARGNLGMVVHVLSPGGGHLFVTQEC